ncbi:cation:proton antiporter [Bacillus mycoides]|uniref:cation:proton antiporter n=1 Tax=Bacillus mycoides TaxID=1405 RepID=UPI001C011B02|nr:cation:proton antiporter [Bacillus mycoides]QWH14190.1 cation:proton antiporter [Bacillus mycoides]
MDTLIFEVGTALVLVAFAAILAAKLKFSIIPFLIILGMLVGPHAPDLGLIDLRFIESGEVISFLGRVGVIFLLFYLGLEFSIKKLIKSGKSIAFGGSVHISLNFILGLLYGYIMGFPLLETLIIAGIIMFDDIFLAVYLSVVSGLVLGGATSFVGALTSVLIAVGYMLLFFVIARKATPFLNKVLDISSNEIFIILIFAILFFVAGFSETIHVAEAIGALLLGLVFSETEHSDRIEHLVVPFRDFFGAIFFFSFGLSIDPFSLGGAVWLALGAVFITLIGNFTAGMIAGRKAGLSHKAYTNIGLTLISRGEFSIIVANLGIAGGLMATIKPFSALYVLILASLGPLLTKESGRIYSLLDKIFKWSAKERAKRKKEVG